MEILVILIFVLLGYEGFRALSWWKSLRKLDKFTYDSSVNTLFIFNTSFRIEKVIKYDMELFSYMPEELIEVSLWDLFSAKIVNKLFCGYRETILDKEINELQLPFFEKKRECTCLVRFIPLSRDRVACLIQPLPLQQVVEISHHEEYAELLQLELSTPIHQRII